MRVKSVSLVRRLELQFRGNVHPNAIALGDVDNDQNNELVVGTLTGHLYIYKVLLGSPSPNVTPAGLPGPSVPPWRTCSGLGTITSVVVGDVRNIGRNSVICINAEGGCFMFDFPFLLMNNELSTSSNTQNTTHTPSLTPTFPNNTQGPVSLASLDESSVYQNATVPVGGPVGVSLGNCIGLSGLIARANWTTSLPTNTSVAMIGDVDGDGLNELVLGLTDRQIHSYQLSTSLALPSPAPFSGRSGVKVQVGRAKSSVDYNKLFWHNKAVWRVSHPIASLSLALIPTPLLVVGQSGGEFLLIDSTGMVLASKHSESFPENCGVTAPAFAIKSPKGLRDVVVSLLPDHSLALSRISEPTEPIGCIPTGLSQRVIGFGEVPSTSTSTSTTTAPTGAIGWADGTTLLLNSQTHACTRFQFPHPPVAAFISGLFSLGPGGNLPFLFYVGFSGAIYGYSDPAALACEPTSRLGAFLDFKINDYGQVLHFIKAKVLCNNSNVQGSVANPGIKGLENSSHPSPQDNMMKNPEKPESISASKVKSEVGNILSPEMSEMEQQALIFRYILYVALPASKQNNTFSLPSPFQSSGKILEKTLQATSKKTDNPKKTFLPVNQHSSAPFQTVRSVLPASLTRRPSALHINFRSPRPSTQATSSSTSDPAVPVITNTSAASSPALGSSTSCVEDLEKLQKNVN